MQLDLQKMAVASGVVMACTSAVMAACYICGEYTCSYPNGGTPCSAGTTTKICENPPRSVTYDAKGSATLSVSSRDARCWTVSYPNSTDWYQGPCGAGPPLGTWNLIGGCGLSEGTCCWTSKNFKSGSYSSAGFQIKDCVVNSPCQEPVPG